MAESVCNSDKVKYTPLVSNEGDQKAAPSYKPDARSSKSSPNILLGNQGGTDLGSRDISVGSDQEIHLAIKGDQGNSLIDETHNHEGINFLLLKKLGDVIGQRNTIWGQIKRGGHSFVQGVKKLPVIWGQAQQWILKKMGFYRQALPKPQPCTDFLQSLQPQASSKEALSDFPFLELSIRMQEKLKGIFSSIDQEYEGFARDQKASGLTQEHYRLHSLAKIISEGNYATDLPSFERPILAAYLVAYSGSIMEGIQARRTGDPTSDAVQSWGVGVQGARAIGNFIQTVATLASQAQAQALLDNAQKTEAMAGKSQASLSLPEGSLEKLRENGEAIRQFQEKVQQFLKENQQKIELITSDLRNLSTGFSDEKREALEKDLKEHQGLQEGYQEYEVVAGKALEIMEGAPLSRKFAESVLRSTQERLFPTMASTSALMTNALKAVALMNFNRAGMTAAEAGATFGEMATISSLAGITLALAIPSFSYLIRNNIASLKQAWNLRGQINEALGAEAFSRAPEEALAHELLGARFETDRGRAFLKAMGKANDPEIVLQGVNAQFWVWIFGLVLYGQVGSQSWVFGAPHSMIRLTAAIGGTWGVAASGFSLAWTSYRIASYFRQHYQRNQWKEVAFDKEIDWEKHKTGRNMLQTSSRELDYRQAAKQVAIEAQHNLKDFVENGHQKNSLSEIITTRIMSEVLMDPEASDYVSQQKPLREGLVEALGRGDISTMSKDAGQTYAKVRLQGKSDQEARRHAKIHFLLQALTRDGKLGAFLESRALGEVEVPKDVRELFQTAGLKEDDATVFSHKVFHTYAQARLAGKSEKVALRQAEAQYRMKRVELQGLPELLDARRENLEQISSQATHLSDRLINNQLVPEEARAQDMVHHSLQRYAENRWKGMNLKEALQKERYLYAESLGQLTLQRLLPGELQGEEISPLNLESLLERCRAQTKAEQKATLEGSKEKEFLVKALSLSEKDALALLGKTLQAYQSHSSLQEAVIAFQKGIIDFAQEPYVVRRKLFGACDELEALLGLWDAKDQQVLGQYATGTSGSMEEEWSALLGEDFQASKTLNAMTLGYYQSYNRFEGGELGKVGEKTTQAWTLISGQARKVFERAIIKNKKGYGSLKKAPEAWKSLAQALQSRATGVEELTEDQLILIMRLKALGMSSSKSQELVDWLFLVSEDQRAQFSLRSEEGQQKQENVSQVIEGATQVYAQKHLLRQLYGGAWKTLASQWKRGEKQTDPLYHLAFLDESVRAWNKHNEEVALTSLVGTSLKSLGMKPRHIQGTLALSALTYEAELGASSTPSDEFEEQAAQKVDHFFSRYLDHAAGVYARNDRAWGKVWERKKWDSSQVESLVKALQEKVAKEDPKLQQWYQESLGVNAANGLAQEGVKQRAQLNARLLALTRIMGSNLHDTMVGMIEDVKLNDRVDAEGSKSRHTLRFLGLPDSLIYLALHARTPDQVHALAHKWEAWAKNPSKAEEEVPAFTQSFV